jgi:hypothetical protein
MSADRGLFDDRYAVATTQRIGASGKQEGSDVGMQGLARLGVAVVLDVDGVTQEGPAVAVVIFDVDVGAGVQEIAQSRQVFLLDRVVGW